MLVEKYTTHVIQIQQQKTTTTTRSLFYHTEQFIIICSSRSLSLENML